MSDSKTGSGSLIEKKISIAEEFLSRDYYENAHKLYCEVLEEDPNNNEAYVGKLLCDKKSFSI